MEKSLFIKTYGCQMNISDGELMEGILASQEYEVVGTPEAADVILVNTCAIREHAETRVLGRVAHAASHICRCLVWPASHCLNCDERKNVQCCNRNFPTS